MPVSSDMKTYLANEALTLTTLWEFIGRNSQTVRLTSHTRDITYDGDLYTSAPVVPTEVERKIGIAPDNFELQIPFRTGEFERDDVLAGVWQNARTRMLIVNYLDLTLGHALLVAGEVTTVGVGLFATKLNVETIAHRLQQPIGDVYSPKCRVKRLGGPGCGVNLTSYTHTRSVTGVTSRRVFTVNGTAQADNYFAFGTCLFTSGANESVEIEVLANTGNTITLMLPAPFDIVNGVGVTLIRGCDRRIETCRDVFSNAVNFQGEPFAPTPETPYKVPE